MLRPAPALCIGALFILGALANLYIGAGLDRGQAFALLGAAADKYGLPGLAVTFYRTSSEVMQASAERVTDSRRKARLDLAADRGLLAARMFLERGEIPPALKIERKLLRVTPWRLDVRFFQYELKLAQGLTEDARKDLFEAVLDTDDAEAAYLLGASFMASGNPTDGARYLAHALNRQADHYRANLSLGGYYVRVGKRPQALERGQAALRAAHGMRERGAACDLLRQAGADSSGLWRLRAGDIAAAYGTTVLVVMLYLLTLPLPWIVRTTAHLLHIPTGRFARRKIAAEPQKPAPRGRPHGAPDARVHQDEAPDSS